MSDASGQGPVAPAAVASETSAGEGSPAQHQRGERLALIARILATAGALLFAVGAWMPWVVVSVYTFVGDQRHDYNLSLSPGDVEGVFGSFVWSLLTVVGLFLLPLLWWRSHASVSYLALRLNSLWVMMAGFSLPSSGLFSGHDAGLVPELHPRYLIITHHGQKLLGFWAATAGVALVAVAIFLSIIPIFFGQRQEWRVQAAEVRSATSTSRPRVALPGASALTVGVALWAVGTFVMPWAPTSTR